MKYIKRIARHLPSSEESIEQIAARNTQLYSALLDGQSCAEPSVDVPELGSFALDFPEQRVVNRKIS